MDITETEKKNIKSRQKKLKKVDFKHVIKYMIYLKNIMKNNRSMMQAPQAIRLGDQEAVMGYDQVGQVSYGDFDENTVSGNMIKNIIKLNEENIFTEDEITNCIAFIKSYADFILFLEYKNPLYMSIAILCIDKKQSSPIQTLPTLQPYSSVVQDYGGGDYGDYGGGDDYGDYGGGGDYGDYGGGDDYGGGGEDDWV